MGFPVHPLLRPHVLSMLPYDLRTAPGAHVGVPSTSVTFIVPLGEPLDVGWARDPHHRHRMTSCVSGLHTEPALIHHDGIQRGIQLALSPGGCRAIFGLPAGALAGELVELGDAVPQLADLPERLGQASSWPARVALVQRWLLNRLAANPVASHRAEVGRALASLTRGVPVAQVADDVGYSRRRLGSLVRDECGLSPKEYQRVARFQSARGELVAQVRSMGRHRGLGAIAADTGYADQAHLTREWRRLTGQTPTVWLAEEFPFLQDWLPAIDQAGGTNEERTTP